MSDEIPVPDLLKDRSPMTFDQAVSENPDLEKLAKETTEVIQRIYAMNEKATNLEQVGEVLSQMEMNELIELQIKLGAIGDKTFEETKKNQERSITTSRKMLVEVLHGSVMDLWSKIFMHTHIARAMEQRMGKNPFEFLTKEALTALNKVRSRN